jgi:signal transduction histidine kinase
MTDTRRLRSRQLLALQLFYTKALETHVGVRIASVLLMAVMTALVVPGWWSIGVCAGSSLAILIELSVKRTLQKIFADPGAQSESIVRAVCYRTVLQTIALCWCYALPYVALAFAPAPGQLLALLFAIGGLAVIASQHSMTRLMATWTSLPMVLIVGVNAIVLAGPMWPVFLIMPMITALNMYVITGATYASTVELIDAQLQAQEQAVELEARVRARTAELDDALQKAQAASQAKSRFLATMSHELRTPLNAVIGFAEIIQEDAREGGLTAIGMDSARVRAAGLHLLGVINEILDITAIEAGTVALKSEPVSLRKMAEEAVEAVRPMALARGNQIDLAIDGDPGSLTTDAARLRQCLGHLLSNAAKFTLGGSIRVRVTRITEGPQAGLASLTVEDSGPGIAPEQVVDLFKPFTQIDDSYNRSADGSGLGLAITRRLARLMGGDVTVQSALGQGSVFTLTVADQRRHSAMAS